MERAAGLVVVMVAAGVGGCSSEPPTLEARAVVRRCDPGVTVTGTSTGATVALGSREAVVGADQKFSLEVPLAETTDGKLLDIEARDAGGTSSKQLRIIRMDQRNTASIAKKAKEDGTWRLRVAGACIARLQTSAPGASVEIEADGATIEVPIRKLLLTHPTLLSDAQKSYTVEVELTNGPTQTLEVEPELDDDDRKLLAPDFMAFPETPLTWAATRDANAAQRMVHVYVNSYARIGTLDFPLGQTQLVLLEYRSEERKVGTCGGYRSFNGKTIRVNRYKMNITLAVHEAKSGALLAKKEFRAGAPGRCPESVTGTVGSVTGTPSRAAIDKWTKQTLASL